MRVVRLASEIDFTGWRASARALRAEGAPPEAVVWTVERDLFSPPRNCSADSVLPCANIARAVVYR